MFSCDLKTLWKMDQDVVYVFNLVESLSSTFLSFEGFLLKNGFACFMAI